MQLTKWYDHESHSERIFLELTPRQAEKLLEFLNDQKENTFAAKTLTIPGVYNHFGKHGEEDCARSVITIGVV